MRTKKDMIDLLNEKLKKYENATFGNVSQKIETDYLKEQKEIQKKPLGIKAPKKPIPPKKPQKPKAPTSPIKPQKPAAPEKPKRPIAPMFYSTYSDEEETN